MVLTGLASRSGGGGGGDLPLQGEPADITQKEKSVVQISPSQTDEVSFCQDQLPYD